MSEFKQRKIRLRPPRKPLSEKAKRHITTALGIVLTLAILYYTSVQIIDRLSGTALVEFFAGFFGKELLVDDKGHTNILVLGVGGEGHEGKDLTDTILIASLNQNAHSVGMLSIPRDLYTESTLGGSRINRLYEKGKAKWDSYQGMDFARATVEEIFSLSIHYVIKVDFEAFEKIVDSVGGIDMYVENTINDPEYPKDGSYEFEPFFLAKGNQHLNGNTALKYVRSRKSSSDFDRSKRQQQVLIALKSKAAEQSGSERKRVLKQLYNTLNDHVETNMSLREMLSLADFGIQWNSTNMLTATLNDEPVFRGGFLYTPLRELYGGAFVLLPAGDNFDSVRLFAQLVLYGPATLQNAQLAILNGTTQSGLAAKMRAILNRFGVRTVAVGNASAQDRTRTTWYIRDPAAQDAVAFLQKILPGKIQNEVPVEYSQNPDLMEANIILELGEESKQTLEKLDIFKNIVSLVPSGNGSTTPPVALPQ